MTRLAAMPGTVDRPRAEHAAGQSFATQRRRAWALFVNFFRRELTLRYLGSVTGFAWALLSPLALLAVYHFVFTTVFRTGALGGQSFLAFVAVALWPWLAAQEGLMRGTVVLANYSGLIRKVAFPHDVVVHASVAATFAVNLAGYVGVLVVLKAFGEPIHLLGLVLALAVWAVLFIAITGLAMAFAALQVFVKDVEYILMPVLTILMYLTPILYPLTMVPQSMRPWVAANPFGWVVTRLRDILLGGSFALEPADAVAVVVACALFVGGRWVFRRLSPSFEDFL